MLVQHQVKGYEEFTKLAESLESSGQTIYILFSGGKEQQTGLSWCNYCVKAEPVVYDCLKHSQEDSFFIHVDVGERDFWNNVNCPFRKDPRTHLVSLPTLLRWKSPQRLDGERCSDTRLVEMLIIDEV
ncbi:Thioredoxin domain-containing protein 17 [Pseudolycoriella hygida]|uniref:Thioredoxin domain-containing protein 17 n=1 Tax=Pseudolycoriella hygida TaxID=35572 RepID=A0A9Q0NFZ4_9DIPT|nr:Thioredoxin domain-containing protein 17 [Pseudolycoriella hygida]